MCYWEISANDADFDYDNYSYQLYVSFQYMAGAALKVWSGNSKETATELKSPADLYETYQVDLIDGNDMKIYIHVTGEAVNPFL